MDLVVLSTRISAYVLVRLCILSEAVLFVRSVIFVISACAVAIGGFHQDFDVFAGIPQGALAVFKMLPWMYVIAEHEGGADDLASDGDDGASTAQDCVRGSADWRGE